MKRDRGKEDGKEGRGGGEREFDKADMKKPQEKKLTTRTNDDNQNKRFGSTDWKLSIFCFLGMKKCIILHVLFPVHRESHILDRSVSSPDRVER